MQHKQHTAQQGKRRDFYLFSPSSPGISKPWPQLCAPSSGQPGAEWDRWTVWGPGSGVALLGQWHGLLLGCAAGKRGASRTEALPSRSMVVILPVLGGGSCDLPACLADSNRGCSVLDQRRQKPSR